MRYFKRPWDETRGDSHEDWGTSIWMFEVGDDGWPVRQIERYLCGVTVTYDTAHREDEYGGLGQCALPPDEFLP